MTEHSNINIAIIGPTSYTSFYLLKLLRHHSAARVTYLASQREQLPNVADEFPALRGVWDLQCQPIDAEAIADAADVAFMCLPHGVSAQYVKPLLAAGLKVIDLSADYRLRDADQYEKVYGQPHQDTANLPSAVYGLPEFFSRQIAGANLVANPGCYPTTAALGIAPLVRSGLVEPGGIIVNAASGITGAGRSPKPNLHFPEMNEAFVPYNVGVHRHQPEIEQTLNAVLGAAKAPADVLFVPHLLPVDRGILASIYMTPTSSSVSEADALGVIRDTYADAPFVRVREALPNIKHVRDTNFCDIAVRVVKGKVVVFSALDNMIKGASGQALQNMNLMCGLDQTDGLL